MREIICVSLFNGMGGAFMALEMSGFNVVQKISSEVDKYAIKANDAMFTDTIQIGDVSKIEVVRDDNGKVVGLKNDKGVEVRFKEGVEIMVCGGSPCQSFSFSGKRKGMATKDEQEILTLEHYLRLKAEDYEFEGQSYLFWEFVRLRDEIKPNYWFLENVEMGEKWEKVLSKAVGVNGVHVNSALLSAQNRKRVYWFNFGMEPMGLFGELGCIVTQPKDKGILLKDILESDVDEKYYLSEKMISGFMKHRDRHTEKGTGFVWNPTDGDTKASCLRANAALCPTDNSIIVHNTLPRSSKTGKGETSPLSRNDGKTYCLDTGCTNAIEIRERRVIQLSNNNKSNGGTQPYQQDRVYDIEGINPSLNTMWNGANLIFTNPSIRRLTPKEALRLQTVPEKYIDIMLNSGISDSQLYKMTGNGWTIEVISYLFNYIK